eukprot:5590522-Pleurochrysis_carterae.AAC.2
MLALSLHQRSLPRHGTPTHFERGYRPTAHRAHQPCLPSMRASCTTAAPPVPSTARARRCAKGVAFGRGALVEPSVCGGGGARTPVPRAPVRVGELEALGTLEGRRLGHGHLVPLVALHVEPLERLQRAALRGEGADPTLLLARALQPACAPHNRADRRSTMASERKLKGT